MIRVRILLCGGHVYETFCSADARLIEDLRRIVAIGANATGMAQLEVEQNGAMRSLAIPYSQIAAIETEPPALFGPRKEPSGIRPAPYIRIPDFLTTDENKAVIDYAIGKRPAFKPSTVEGGAPGYRHSQVLFKLDDLEIDFEGKVREILPDVTGYFGLGLPVEFTFEMQMTTHSDGGFFKIHNDNGSPNTASQFLTYVYYFHQEPVAFSGGQLRLLRRLEGRGLELGPGGHFRGDQTAEQYAAVFSEPALSRGATHALSNRPLRGRALYHQWMGPYRNNEQSGNDLMALVSRLRAAVQNARRPG